MYNSHQKILLLLMSPCTRDDNSGNRSAFVFLISISELYLHSRTCFFEFEKSSNPQRSNLHLYLHYCFKNINGARRFKKILELEFIFIIIDAGSEMKIVSTYSPRTISGFSREKLSSLPCTLCNLYICLVVFLWIIIIFRNMDKKISSRFSSLQKLKYFLE